MHDVKQFLLTVKMEIEVMCEEDGCDVTRGKRVLEGIIKTRVNRVSIRF